MPTARRKADEIIRLKEEGVRPSEIASRLGIGRASVYRVLETEQEKGDGLICLIAADDPPSGLQRAFLAWFEEAGSRLTVAIKVGCSTPDSRNFGFVLANPVLIGSLATCGDLVISAEWEGNAGIS